MKVVRKVVDWDNEKQEMYHESFTSYQDLWDTLDKREQTTRALKNVFEEHDYSFMNVRSIEEAKNFLFNGWETPLERIKKETMNNVKKLDVENKSKSFNDVVGYQPIVANALMGLPKSMINVHDVKVQSKVIRFLIMIDRSWSTTTDEIIKRMSKILAHIANLERNGKYRCRLEVSFAAFGGHQREGMINTSGSVLIKSENQLLDIKRLCFPVVHPAMLRLLMFAWNEGLPLNKDKYYCRGYGTSFEYWSDTQKDAFRKSIQENNEKVLVVDLHTDIEEMLKDF